MRWVLLLLALGFVGWSAEEDIPVQAPMLEPGEDYAQLQALGWVDPWQVEDGTLLLRFHAPAGAAWTADDVVRVKGDSYHVTIQVPWQGVLEPDAFDLELWSPDASCQRLDLLAGDGPGACQGENRMRLHLALPPEASGSGWVVVGFQPA